MFPGRVTFFLMEIVSPISFILATKSTNFNWFLGAMFVAHYLYRSVIYSFFISYSMKPIDLMVLLSAASFNVLNGYNQAQGVATVQTISVLGVAVWLVGLAINVHSDIHLCNLRKSAVEKTDPRSVSKPAKTDYFIPVSGMYEYVSCANYFGEIVEVRDTIYTVVRMDVDSVPHHHDWPRLLSLHRGKSSTKVSVV